MTTAAPEAPEAAPAPEAHVLGELVRAGDVITIECSCKVWVQGWHAQYHAPDRRDIEQAHRMHVLASTRHRLTPPVIPPAVNAGLDALAAACRAMAEFAETAAESLTEFVDAHTAAKANGVGVLITRGPGGTIHSTPNVYLAPGVVLYAEEPGAPWVPASFPFKDARAPFEPGTGWLPRYTRPTHDAPLDGVA